MSDEVSVAPVFPTVEPSALADSRGEEARAFLQDRIGLMGKVLFLINVVYFPVFNLALSLGSEVPLRTRLQESWSWEALAEYLVFGFMWSVRRLPPQSLERLGVIDALSTFAFCSVSATWCFLHPYPAFGVYEFLLGTVAVLCLRAILVPSTALRTAVIGTVACVPGLVSVVVASKTRIFTGMSFETLIIMALNWCGVGVSFSSVASAVIYGLRKQVRDARKLGQYTLVQQLGTGGMGVVYLATHAMLRRKTAIKLLRPELSGQRALQRFEREVQITSQLTHPNTVAIYDYGRTADGVFYYVMEYLDGIDLDELVAVDGPQRPARVIHILKQVCGALAEAHGQGLLHRDIKPANVVLCQRQGAADVAKVLDFGLVKELKPSADVAHSQGSTLTGTPLFLSPESISAPDSVDARSDLYALGATGYFLLTGQHVFDGRTVIEVCASHLHKQPVPPGERLGRPVPSDLEAILMRCLSKKREDRFEDALQLYAALEECADADRWTAGDAQRWWAQHREAIESARAQKPDRRVMSESQTVFTDLPDRLPKSA